MKISTNLSNHHKKQI